MTDGVCGAECVDGSECQHPAGSCPVGSHSDARADGGGSKPGPKGPNKFDEEHRGAILTAACRGTTVEGCARAAGIGTSTLYEWLDDFPEFSEAFRRARAEGEQELIEAAVADDPKWVLERSYDYVKTERRELEHSGEIDGFEFSINAGDED